MIVQIMSIKAVSILGMCLLLSLQKTDSVYLSSLWSLKVSTLIRKSKLTDGTRRWAMDAHAVSSQCPSTWATDAQTSGPILGK